MGNPDGLGASGDFEEFASIAAAATNFSGVTRSIRVLADGVLVLKQAEGGVSRTMTVKANTEYKMAVVAFVAAGSSGAAPIQVFR